MLCKLRAESSSKQYLIWLVLGYICGALVLMQSIVGSKLSEAEKEALLKWKNSA